MANPDGIVSPSDIFTTLRHDPSLLELLENARFADESTPDPVPIRYTAWYMFQFHLEKLQESASQFGCVQPSTTTDHLAALDRELEGQLLSRHKPDESDVISPAWRVRLVLDSVGGIKIDQVKPVSSLPRSVLYPDTLDPPSQFKAPLYELFLCPHPTTPSSFTRHKTARRDVYTAARIACNLPAEPTADPIEALLWNPAGELMEGSLTSVYCRRNGQWVTPAARCGGNQGTTRRWAIEMETCTEGVIMAEHLVEGEVVCISNGVRGFIYGVVRRKFFDAARRAVAL
jgi:4-amino-4-deoxychorismate lyase